MGRADATGGQHIVVPGPAYVDRIDDLGLDIGHNAGLSEADALLIQPFRDMWKVSVNRSSRKDLIADDDQAGGDGLCFTQGAPRFEANG